MTTNEVSTSAAVAEHEAGRLDQAESLYRARLSQFPDDLATIIGLADVLTDAGQLTEAEGLYRKAIALDGESPAAAGAYDGLAAIRQDLGDLEAAIPASKKAAVLRGSADDSFGVGNTLEFLGRTADAIEMFILATQQRPGFAQAHIKAAQHLLASGRFEESVPHYVAAIEVHPDLAELHCNLANAYRRLRDLTPALKSVRRAIELKPQLAEAHNIMGVIWKDRRRPSDALESFKRALELKPEYAEVLNNIGGVYETAGQVEKAGEFYARAVAMQGEAIQFHENLAYNCLLRGHFPLGWQEFEWRRLKPSNPGSRPFPQPTWDGSSLEGKTIVLFAEQGFGDTIQFLRYAPLVAQRGARVILEIQPALLPLASKITGVAEAFAQGKGWPACDCQCALMSLPLVFKTELESIPREIPYIKADLAKVQTWKAKLQSTTGRRVGLVGAGSATNTNDRNRSCPPGKLAPLAEVTGVSFVSLQKRETDAPPTGLNLLDLTTDLTDFSDTAALIENLDLVIAVDTAVAHLAGAMGKPVWILLPAVNDWRWLMHREDSPWYPTARLFRQETPGDWTGVINKVCDALRKTSG
jgi:tetratricopeptide (TPR) repeat protein